MIEIRNWLINLTKGESVLLSNNIKDMPRFNEFFWKSLLSLQADTRFYNEINNDLLNNIFKNINNISLLDKIENFKIIINLIQDSKIYNYKLLSYLLKNEKTSREYFEIVNKNNYSFSVNRDDIDELTVIPILIVYNMFEDYFKKYNNEFHSKHSVNDIPMNLYFDILTNFSLKINPEVIPSFFNQLASILNIISIDYKEDEHFLKLQRIVNSKKTNLPFVIKDEESKNILVDEFEYMLYMFYKLNLKIININSIKKIFIDYIEKNIVDKNKDNILPCFYTLIKAIEVKLNIAEKLEKKQRTPSQEKLTEILSIKSFIERISFLKILENPEKNKNIIKKRRI